MSFRPVNFKQMRFCPSDLLPGESLSSELEYGEFLLGEL